MNEEHNKRCRDAENCGSSNVEQLLKKAKLRIQNKENEPASSEIEAYKQQQDTQK